MHECERGEQASLYALGLLEGADRSAFEQHLDGCAECTAEVRQAGDVAVELARSIPESAAPAALRSRVLLQASLPKGVVALARGANLKWHPTPFPGVTAARLYEDPVSGDIASLVRMAAGGYYPSHHHAGLEHVYVVEGDIVFQDHVMTAGDYSAGCGGDDHSAATTKNGCLLFIIHNMRDQIHAH